MEKEMNLIKEAEERFQHRQVLAKNTGKDMLEKKRQQTNEEIHLLQIEFEKWQKLELATIEEEIQAAQMVIDNENKEIQNEIREAFEVNKEAAKMKLIDEVFDYGNR